MPAEAHAIKAAARQRAARLAALPRESNGYTMLAFIPKPGNPPERQAVYDLSRFHPSQETPPTAGLPQALAAFRRTRPLFDHALERPAMVYPGRLEGLTLATWLACAYLMDGANRDSSGDSMRAYLKTWRLGVLTARNPRVRALNTGVLMIWLASESLQPLIANGKLSPSEFEELEAFLAANRLQPEDLLWAADAEAAAFEDSLGGSELRGAGAVLPGFLGDAFRQRQVRVYDVNYLRLRPCLFAMTPCTESGHDPARVYVSMDRSGDRMAAEAFPDLEEALLSYRFTLDRQDQLLAAVALQRAWRPDGGYPSLASLGLELTPRLRLLNSRLVLDGRDYPGLGQDELELKLKPPAARLAPPPRAP